MKRGSTTPNRRCINSRKRPGGWTYRRYEETTPEGIIRFTTIEIPMEEYNNLTRLAKGEEQLGLFK